MINAATGTRNSRALREPRRNGGQHDDGDPGRGVIGSFEVDAHQQQQQRCGHRQVGEVVVEVDGVDRDGGGGEGHHRRPNSDDGCGQVVEETTKHRAQRECQSDRRGNREDGGAGAKQRTAWRDQFERRPQCEHPSRRNRRRSVQVGRDRRAAADLFDAPDLVEVEVESCRRLDEQCDDDECDGSAEDAHHDRCPVRHPAAHVRRSGVGAGQNPVRRAIRGLARRTPKRTPGGE